MQSTRLWQLISCLSNAQMRELYKAVNSPFFNQRRVVCELFDFLYSCKTELRLTPTKLQVHRRLFPGQEYLDKRVRNAMSLLLKTLEQALSVQQYLVEEGRVELGTARVYRELGLDRHYEYTMKKVERRQREAVHRNADYYQQHYRFQEERYRWLSLKNRTADLNLQEVSDNLDLAFLARKLSQACFSLSHQTVYAKDYDYGLLTKLLELIKGSHYLEIPAIALYYYCYHSLSNPSDETSFRHFKSLLVAHSKLFPLREIRDLYLLATNYCIKRMNEGDRHFAQEGLEIYKEGLDNDYLLVNGFLSRFTYRNIVTKALVSREYDWVEVFMQTYKDRLEATHRNSDFSFNLARLKYEQSKYDEALTLLQAADYKDLLLNLSAKTLAAKIYYQLEAFDLLEAHLQAMRIFIRRQKKIGYHQENYLNFVASLRKILELPKFDKTGQEKLRTEIEETKSLAERRWLVAQLS